MSLPLDRKTAILEQKVEYLLAKHKELQAQKGQLQEAYDLTEKKLLEANTVNDNLRKEIKQLKITGGLTGQQTQETNREAIEKLERWIADVEKCITWVNEE